MSSPAFGASFMCQYLLSGYLTFDCFLVCLLLAGMVNNYCL